MPETSIRAFADNAVDPKVRGVLHTPETPNGNALILTHGAGSNAQAPLLVAMAETFSAAGFTVLRCDLPYRQSRSYGPPGPGDAARDRAGLKNAIAATARQILGGPSRRSCERCEFRRPGPPHRKSPRRPLLRWTPVEHALRRAFGEGQEEEPDLVAALLLLSYPLHPPRKPEQQRTQHLPDLRTPALFVHGTRDPFGSIAEMEQALKMIPAKTKLVAVEGAGHDLGFKGKSKREELPARILSEFTQFLSFSS